MSRLVLPNLFEVWGGRITVENVERQSLRWMLADSVGLPTVAFQVWGWTDVLPVKEVSLTSTSGLPGDRIVRWSGGAAIAIQLTVDVAAGQTAVLRGMSGPNASGQVADLESVPGPVSGRAVVLSASAIRSATVTGAAAVGSTASVLLVQPVVDAPNWRLLDRVGLPADGRFSGLYSLDPQGAPGADAVPPDAAMQRVKAGLPDIGWAASTDLGAPAPSFDKPDAGTLVRQDLSPLLDAVAKLLDAEHDASKHAETWVDVGVRAPESIHGVAASAHWQSGAVGRVRPLGSLRFAAATDPAAALALGFGTTLDRRAKPPTGVEAAAAASQGIVLFMVTVTHKVVIADVPPLGEVVLEGDLTGFHIDLPPDPVDVPVGVAASRTGLDRPAAVDRPWLEISEVSWASPIQVAAQRLAPKTYAVLRADGSGAPASLLDKRQTGGYEPFAAAFDPEAQPAPRVTFDDRGIAEAFPSDNPVVTYSVAAQDWFGRWSGWRSVGYTRGSVAPQIPAVASAAVQPESSGPPGAATASVEVTWDWSNRTPASIAVRTQVLAAPGSGFPGTGSILQVGGPEVADHVIDCSTATPATPPPGVTEVLERRTGELRTYTVTVPGLVINHALADHIDVAMSANAIERVRPAVQGAFSPPSTTTLVSPLPPPPPFIPAGMVWASLPDPAGVSRITLNWAGSAPSYAVYVADETSIARELGLPSPDLDQSAAQRLVALRSVDLPGARRAFRRLASALPGRSLLVELPRGSRLIQFHAVVGVSGAGVESPFPSASNDLLAVATPELARPATPVLTAHPSAAGVELAVEVSERDRQVERIEVFRVVGRSGASALETAGPPVMTLPASAGTRADGVLRATMRDLDPLPSWRTLCYRAVVWAEGDVPGGVVSGRSDPSAVVEAVVPAAAPPDLTDLRVDDIGEPGVLLTSVASTAPRERTARGPHRVTVTALGPAAAVTVRRGDLDRIPLAVGPLPSVDLFLHHTSDPVQARLSARIPADTVLVSVEVSDPVRQTSRLSLDLP